MGISTTFEPGVWNAPTLLNGWVNYGVGHLPAGYMRDRDGIVVLRGLIQSGTVSAAAFALPPGYRPWRADPAVLEGSRLLFTVVSNTTSSNQRVDALDDGTVMIYTTTNGYVSLDGIHFRGEVLT